MLNKISESESESYKTSFVTGYQTMKLHYITFLPTILLTERGGVIIF